jgi:hypothetical protein
MAEAGAGGGRTRWTTAAALAAAVVFLSVLDAVPLVAVPTAILLAALSFPRRWKWLALATVLWVVGLALPGGPLGGMSRAWALLLGVSFLALTLARPAWSVLSRSLLSLGLALVLAAAWITVSGDWSTLDAHVREQLLTVSSLAFSGLKPEGAPSAVEQLAATARRVALLQWNVFPAILALQSLAALALGSWAVSRIRRGENDPFEIRPLREFRFNDQLVWLLVVGLVLLALPLGGLAPRLGYNALLFMGGLYALRGLAVFVFLAGGAPTLFTVIFGVLAAIFLYPLVLTAAVLVGLGDTWLDVRGRAAAAGPRT